MNNLPCHTGLLGSLGSWGTWGWIGMILHLAIWIGLIAGPVMLIVWTIRRARVPAAPAPQITRPPNAKEILEDRYARDEITREQYEIMKKDLGISKKGEMR